MNKFSQLFLLAVAFPFVSLPVQSPRAARADILTKNTVWQGEVKVPADVLVPRGITLTIRPGTRVTVASADSTKTDPEYMSPQTEITVRGTLRVEGTAGAPVEFSGEGTKPGSWAGIIIDRGDATLGNCRIRNAETALYVLDGTAHLQDAVIEGNRYGLVAEGQHADVAAAASRITDNDYGVFALQGARMTVGASQVRGNRKRDSYTFSVAAYRPGIEAGALPALPVSRQYGDEALRGDTIWEGRIVIDGTIRVPEGSRLIVMPGTTVEFRKKDTNHDGIGESGLLIQGRFIAKGTAKQPIVFRSAEQVREMGDWDSINIMNSDGGQNLVEHCRIEDAYRGLHFHFSNVAVLHSVLTNNYRAIQFQESLVELKGNYLYGNKSGLQGRDSDVSLLDNVIANNDQGANFFRDTLVARGNRITGNAREGVKIREGVTTLQGNLVDGNRQGLLVADEYYGDFSGNSFSRNIETGLSLKNVDNLQIHGNFIAANGMNGMNVQEARAAVRGNLISDNGERGIGVISFAGVITENNFIHNGQYAVDLEGARDVSAPANWWGGDSPGRVINDKRTDAARGRVDFGKPLPEPVHFVWPLRSIVTDTAWCGVVAVTKATTVRTGATLRIAPGTVVEFSPGTGLAVRGGRFLSVGKENAKIVFTSARKKGPSDWDEIVLEYATGSVISHAVFEYATWGLHSHFTNLRLSDSLFTNNYGGVRFRSGPMEIVRSTFEGNHIGIRSYIGKAVLRENTITKNEIGIFVREKGGGLTITRNNIFDNSSYNIRIGDFNDQDVNARENWWGPGNPVETIYDARREPGIGTVLLDPYLKKPVSVKERGAR